MKLLQTEKEGNKIYPSRMLWRENVAFRKKKINPKN